MVRLYKSHRKGVQSASISVKQLKRSTVRFDTVVWRYMSNTVHCYDTLGGYLVTVKATF